MHFLLTSNLEEDKRFKVETAFHLFIENKMNKTNECFQEN